MLRNRLAAVAAIGICLLPLAGCGGVSVGDVAGTITAKGQPLQAGVVTFFPAAGTPVTATVANGTYSATGLPYGDYRITVTPLAEAPQVTMSSSGQPLKPGQVDPNATAPAPRKKVSPIADKYGSVDSSGLSCKVDQPKVDYPIKLD